MINETFLALLGGKNSPAYKDKKIRKQIESIKDQNNPTEEELNSVMELLANYSDLNTFNELPDYDFDNLEY